MSEEKEKMYELELDGIIYTLKKELFDFIINTKKERDISVIYLSEIMKAQEYYSNDADLGGWIRDLVNDIKSKKPITSE
jgi:hypothetical protein